MRAVNLLPAAQRPVRATGEQSGSAYVVLGVLGAVLLGVLMFVLTSNGIADKKEKIATVEREALAAQTEASALAPYGLFAEVSKTRLASVRDRATARVDWERLLREMSLVLPKSAYVTELNAQAAPAPDAAAAPVAAGASPTPTVTVGGCAKRHRDVATVLVRLNEMHRVADATLVESSRAESSGGGSAAAGGGAAACSAYAFSVVLTMVPVVAAEAPRGHTSVPAKLGGGS